MVIVLGICRPWKVRLRDTVTCWLLACESVTVAVWTGPPESMGEGTVRLAISGSGGKTTVWSVLLDPPKVAVAVADTVCAPVASPVALTSKEAEFWPACTLTDDGICRFALLEESATVAACGAAALRKTWAVFGGWPQVTVSGRTRDESASAAGATVVLAERDELPTV